MATGTRHQLAPRTAALLLMETTFISAAVLGAALATLGTDAGTEAVVSGPGLLRLGVVAGVTQVCLYFADLYDLRVVAARRELFVRVLQALSASTLVLAALYFLAPSLVIGQGVVALAAPLVIAIVIGWRVAFEWMSTRLGGGERLLLIGATPAAIALAREILDRRHELGVEIVGFVDVDPARVGEPLFNPSVIGTIEDIPTLIHERRVDRVVVSLAEARGHLPMDRLLDMKLRENVAFDHLATVYEEYTGKIAVENLRPSWLIFSEGFRKNRRVLATKRAMDILLSATGLVLALPLMLVVAVLVKVTSPGPVLYRQVRVGLEGRLFTVRKFRSMQQDAEARTGAVWAAKNDARVTPIGRFLRRTRLDELPQLWNALVGEMSLVGPRPERPEFVESLTQQLPYYGQRHAVKPGVTGWAQVRYTYGASVEDALQKLQYDLYYIKHMSISFDLFILFDTVKTVVLRRGA